MDIMSYQSIIILISLIALSIYIYNAASSFLFKPRNILRILFICTNVAMAIWTFSFMHLFIAPNRFVAIMWYKFAALGYCTYYAFALHFTLIICMRNSSRHKKVALGLIYSTCIPFIVLFFINKFDCFTFYKSSGLWLFSINSMEPWLLLYFIVSTIPLIITLFICYNCMRKSTSLVDKKKYIIIFVSQLISTILGIHANVIFPLLKISLVPPIASILTIFYTLGLSYLIKNYSLISVTPAIAVNQIISKVTDMIVLTDTNGIIVEVNESLTRTLNYTGKDLLGIKFDSLLLVNDLLTPHIILNNSDTNIVGFSLITSTNKRIPVSLSISKIYSEENTLIGNVYILQDKRLLTRLKEEISEKENLAMSLVQINEQLKDLDKLKSDFICNVSHELRTPICLMLSSLKLSLYKFTQNNGVIDSTHVYKQFEILNQNCFRLTRIINNIIDISKIDASTLELNLSNNNIIHIIEEITLSVASFIKNKGVTLIFDTEIEERVMACDPDQIERIILNLISNAFKFTDVGGEIFVNIIEAGDTIEISVTDTGIGIPQDKQQSIFEKFIQVDKSLSRLCEGSGIGLTLVKSLVELHKGKISLKSELNVGSTFTITLPVYIIEDNAAGRLPHFDSTKNINEKVSIEFSDIYKVYL